MQIHITLLCFIVLVVSSADDIGNTEEDSLAIALAEKMGEVAPEVLAEMIANAPVIEGERKPDDESDKEDHRNGFFMNNEFFPFAPVNLFWNMKSR